MKVKGRIMNVYGQIVYKKGKQESQAVFTCIVKGIQPPKMMIMLDKKCTIEIKEL